MTDYYTIITDKGKAKLAAAISDQQTVKLTHLAIGDGDGQTYHPSATQHALNRELWRVSLSHLQRDGDHIMVEAIIPGEVGGFYIREVGIYDSDNVLFAIGKVPETYKPNTVNGVHKQIVLRLFFAVSDAAASITLDVDPLGTMPTKAYVDTAIDGAKTGVIEQVATKLPLAGGTLTGNVSISHAASPTITLKSQNAASNFYFRMETLSDGFWDITSLANASALNLRHMSGHGGSQTVNYSFSRDGNITSTLATQSTEANSFAKKNYVDAENQKQLSLAGGTLEGHLTLNYSHPAVLLRPNSAASGTGSIVWEGTAETQTSWDIRRTNVYDHFQIVAINPANSQDYCRFSFFKDGTVKATTTTNSTDPNSFVKKNYVDSLFYPQNGTITYASNTLTLDCAKGQVFEYTLTANTTIAITNKPAGANHVILLKLTKGGNYTVTHPAGCKFVGGSKLLTTNGLDYISYYLDSAGGVVANILKDIK